MALICPGCDEAFERDPARPRQRYCTPACQNRDSVRRWRRKYPEKDREGWARWHSAHPDAKGKSSRRYKLRSKYGLTPDEYEAMYQAQRGRCAICERERDALVVDHSHKSGVVRQLLCASCNWMLGHAADEPVVLVRAAQYLEAHA